MTDDTKKAKKTKAKKTDFEKYIGVLDAGKAKADDRHRAASEVKRIYQQLQIAHREALAEGKKLSDDKTTAERLHAKAVADLAKALTKIVELEAENEKLKRVANNATAGHEVASKMVGDLLKEVELLEGQKAISPPITRTIIAKPAYEIWRTNLKANTIVFAKVDSFWFTFNGGADKLHELMPELAVLVAVVGEDQRIAVAGEDLRTNCIRFPVAAQERITANVANAGTAMAWAEVVGEGPVKPEEKPETEEPVKSGQGMLYAQLAQRLAVGRDTYSPWIAEAQGKAGDKPLTENQWRGLHARMTGHVASSLRETINYVATKEWKGRAVTILGGKYTLVGSLPKTGTWAITLTRTGEMEPRMSAGVVGAGGKWLASHALEKDINTYVKALAEPKPDPKVSAPIPDAGGQSPAPTNTSETVSTAAPVQEDGSAPSTHKGEINRVGPK
jgi:hypothetical protein